MPHPSHLWFDNSVNVFWWVQCNVLQRLVTSSFSDPNTVLSTLTKFLCLYSSLKVTEKCWHSWNNIPNNGFIYFNVYVRDGKTIVNWAAGNIPIFHLPVILSWCKFFTDIDVKVYFAPLWLHMAGYIICRLLRRGESSQTSRLQMHFSLYSR
jgi:hypothetical protein